jgi:hypothetical protein
LNFLGGLFSQQSSGQNLEQQQVQYNTDLSIPRQGYLHRKDGVDYKGDETFKRYKNGEYFN